MKIKNIILFVLLVVGLAAFYTTARASITSEQPKPVNVQRAYTFFSATTTTATSTNIIAGYDANGIYDTGAFNIAGAKRLTFFFSRGGSTGANTGLTNFKVEVSPNGTDWIAYSRLIGPDVAETATTSATIVAATSTVAYSMDLDVHQFFAVRCIAVETTDGDHTCKALADW